MLFKLIPRLCSTLLMVIMPFFYGHANTEDNRVINYNSSEVHSDVISYADENHNPSRYSILDNCFEQAVYNYLLKVNGFTKSTIRINFSCSYFTFSIQKQTIFHNWNPVFYLLYRKLRL